VSLKSFFIHHQFRAAAIGSAVFLGLGAILLGISITGSLFDLQGVFSGPGNFFVKSYGILALIIPAYLFYAALLLADPRYRPDRIFLLNCTLFPFMTIAVGFAFIRDFDFWETRFSYLKAMGKTGFSFTMILLTVIEGCVISLLWGLFFPQASKREARQNRRRQGRPGEINQFKAGPDAHYSRKALPGFRRPAAESRQAGTVPMGAKPALPPPQGEAGGIYAETDYTGNEGSPRADLNRADFPELKPLRSAAAFKELDSLREDDGEKAGELECIEDEDGCETLEEINNGEARTAGLDEAEALLPEEGVLNADGTGVCPDTTCTAAVDAALDADLEQALAEAEENAARRREKSPLKEDGKTQKTETGPSLPKSKKRRSYGIPVEGILNQYPDGQYWIIDQVTRDAAVTLKETLKEFNIQAEVTGIRKGPVITMFEILPAPGVKLSKIVNLQDNIALRLAASSVRIVAPIPGKHAVGIEVPNAKRNIVSFREIIEGELLREGKKPEIPVVLGKDITGEAVSVDLVIMPHLLIAGSTGSGKSVCVNSMILSILYQKPPAECRLILIDPKIVELKLYNDIPHLLTPVITEPKKAFQALQYCIYEMERRYACLDSMGVRDIRSYNKRIKERGIAVEHMPYIVVVIDEFADLMATTGKELESTVARLAAMSRAVGIHLVLATQRPSIDVITGLIKANIPSRIAFMVASKMDSRIIIDLVGAEKLLGKGDMLYAGAVDPFPIRMQGAFISEEEVERVVEYVKTLGEPDYIDEEMFYDDEDDEVSASLFNGGEDPLYEKALEIVLQQGKASASYIQRRLKIGYNRAARLVEEMEHQGVVGPAQGSKPRELLRGA
jgi:S-DNA-T family DNA segregation ATPase FtsK/SpoIIIE